MPRNTDIKDVVFPVEMRDLYYEGVPYEDAPSQSSLFGGKRAVPVPSHKAVVDVERGRALGVVGKAYRLLTNAEALEIAKAAFAQYFESVEPDSFEVYDIVMPKTRSFCHIDLINRHYRVDQWEQDTWLPYLRVTNSYNGSRALRLELGFVRRACSNGMIFSKETVAVRVSHTKEDLGRNLDVQIEGRIARLKELEAEFVDYLTRIRASRVPRLYALPIIAKSLGLRFQPDHENDATRERERAKLKRFKVDANELVDRYYGELGPHAYAVFNAATDYASHLSSPRDRQRIAPLQVRAGQWLREYADLARRPDFDLDVYVGDYLPIFAATYP